MSIVRALVILCSLPVVLAACAPAPSSTAPASADAAPRVTARKHVVAAITGAPPMLNSRFNTSTNKPGWNEAEMLYNTPLTSDQGGSALQPLLVESVPTIENAGWIVSPDGTMQTRLTIRSGATWHDGSPLTTDDILFSGRVFQDSALPQRNNTAFSYLDRVEAVDGRTLVAYWKRPFINADAFPSDARRTAETLLPAHILQAAYEADHQSILTHPYFNTEFVGTGPFKVTRFEPGVSISLSAFDQYVLGRPRIDEIEVQSILDLGTTMANIMAGAIDITLGRGLSTEQGIQLRSQWQGGRVDFDFKSGLFFYGQYVDPTPPVVADVRFHKALMYALDRQGMVDGLQYGVSKVMEIPLDTDHPAYSQILPRAARYPYDPRRAAQLLQEAGYARGADGLLHDARGQNLEVEVRTTGELDIHLKTIAAFADDLAKAGMVIEQVVIPTQRAGDRPYRVSYPGLQILRGPYGEEALMSLNHSRNLPTPENGYVGGNYPRFSNPEWDALLDRYAVTIPQNDRMQALGAIVLMLEDQLSQMSLFYDTQLVLFSNRLTNVDKRGSLGFNAETWDLK